MKAEILFAAIGGADDELLERSERNNYIKHRFCWVKAGIPVAACICLVLAGILVLSNFPHRLSDHININELNAEPSISGFEICLFGEDFVAMTDKELMTYFNINIPHQISFGIFLQEQNPQSINGIFKNNERGVYYDTHTFSYANIASTKEVKVTLSKDHVPYSFICSACNKPMQESTVGGVTMTIAHYTSVFSADEDDVNSEIFYAEFMRNGNGYAVMSKNMNKNIFLKVLNSLVK